LVEWNDKYRDEVREYWRNAPGSARHFTMRFAGSPDLFGSREPVNYVTCHDGFTLHDLVSYESKHNEANGEENRDGTNDNRSWNCGAEGVTDDPAINALRERQKRNFLATLLLSRGIPMLLAGDEMSRTQGGNNNAYCQNNDISWFDWEHGDHELRRFVQAVILLRRRHRGFKPRAAASDGASARAEKHSAGKGSEIRGLVWFGPEGEKIDENGLHHACTGALQVLLRADDGDRGVGSADQDLVIMFNPRHVPTTFTLPWEAQDAEWVRILDSTLADVPHGRKRLAAGREVSLASHSLVVLRSAHGDASGAERDRAQTSHVR
jgi:glycogen operon protein